MRIDSHVHAFAERIVERAMTALRQGLPAGYKSFDGRLDTLLQHLDENGLERAVLCTIATKPEQFKVIMEWLGRLRGGELGARAAEMIIPLPSVHPDSPERYREIETVAKEGYRGIKLHPYYQRCLLDSDSTIDFMRCARANGLVVVSHTGYDIGFPRDPICNPLRIARLLDFVPDLKLVAAHLGGWLDWDEVERVLLGREVYLDISMTQRWLAPERFRELLLRHSPEHLLYGSDWPWGDQAEDIEALEALELPAELMAGIMGQNAARLF